MSDRLREQIGQDLKDELDFIEAQTGESREPIVDKILARVAAEVDKARREQTEKLKAWCLEFNEQEHDQFTNPQGTMIRRLDLEIDRLVYLNERSE